MLVIEGPDCVGKTTLAETMLTECRKLGHQEIQIAHMTRPDEATFDFFTDYWPMINPNLIRDRFHLGGVAYHDNKITDARLSIIEGWIRSHGGYVVLIYAGLLDTYEERLRSDPRGNLLRNETMLTANRRYKGLANCNHHGHHADFVWDIYQLGPTPFYVTDDMARVIVKRWLERRKEYYHAKTRRCVKDV